MTVYSTKATRTRSRINLSASTRRPQLFGFARRRLAAPVRDRAGPRTVSAIVSSAKRFWILREKGLIAQAQQRRRLRRPAEHGRQVPVDGPCIPPARDAQDTHAALRSGWQR